MVDRYTSGRASRISPEAPVLVLNTNMQYEMPGGAANVASNVVSLGGRTILCGVVGNDNERRVFLSLLKRAGISSAGIVTDKSRPTTLKHRFLAGATQLARFDSEDPRPLTGTTEKELIRKIRKLAVRADVFVLSDYNKGTLTPTVVNAVKTLAKKYKKKVIADIKPEQSGKFIGVDLIKPNLKEAQVMTGERDVVKMGKALVKKFKSDVFLTRGGEGISIFDKKGHHTHLPAKKVTVFNVSGAGDTVAAVAALSLGAGASLVEAARLANAAAQIVVQKEGTATASIEDILSVLTIHLDSTQAVPKLWGEEKWLENNDKYCCKQLTIKKGYQCSLHYHKVKDEMFLLTKGHIRLELGDKVLYMREGNFVRVPTGVPHRFRGLEDSVIIEISTHHEDSDSYRLEESRKVGSHEK
jgi:D-beta-D-heptose 7-phosphate kinase/D-beta-D-heptose 1-phosphate adenosyltransferase